MKTEIKSIRTAVKYNKPIAQHVVRRAKLGLPTTIIGMPGLAKNSIVKAIKTICNDDGDINCVVINSQGIPETNPYNIFYAIRKELLKLVIDAPSFEAYSYDENIYKVIDEIQGLLIELSKKKNRTIMLFKKFSQYKANNDVYGNINALRDYANKKVSFVFVDNAKLFKPKDGIKTYSVLYDQIMSTIIWMKLPGKAFFEDEIIYWQEYYGYKFPNELKEFIWQQTAGHPALLKHMISYFFENSTIDYELSTMTEHFTLNTKLEQILSVLNENDILTLKKIAQSGSHTGITDSETITGLKNYDLIEEDNGNFKVRIGLLSEYLLQDQNKFEVLPSTLKMPETEIEQSYKLKLQYGEVYLDDEKLNEDFSEREYHLLEYMAGKRGQICTRDELAKVIWKDDATEKYSDWGLDQSISRLRKKLGDSGYNPKYIKTLRGRGFRLEL